MYPAQFFYNRHFVQIGYNIAVTARTHDLAAISALATICLLAPPATIGLSTAMMAIIANLIGGIIPDIDQPTAPLWRNLPVGRYVGKVTDKLLGGHRFLTHSLLGMAITGYLIHWLLSVFRPILGSINPGYVWWAFMIGMTSHLVLDSFTKEGVPWLLPLPVKLGLPPVKSWRITSGGAIETFGVFPALIVYNIWLYTSHYQTVLILLHQRII